MISRIFIDRLHQLSIEHYGGNAGIRDAGLLESAIARPFQRFEGMELYSTPFEKAAAICESIIINHPYVDGNKRTGFLAMYALLLMHNIRLTASEDDAYYTMIGLATGLLKFEDLKIWLIANANYIS